VRTPFSETLLTKMLQGLAPVEKAGTSAGAKKAWQKRERAKKKAPPARAKKQAEEQKLRRQGERLADEAKKARRKKHHQRAGGLQERADELLEGASRLRQELEGRGGKAKPAPKSKPKSAPKPKAKPKARPKPASAPAPMPEGLPQRAVSGNSESMREAQRDAAFVMAATPFNVGIGETWIVEMADGSKAIYKPTKGTGFDKARRMARDASHYRHDLKVGEAAREIATHELDKALGFNVVPPVEKVEYEATDAWKSGGPTGGGGHAMAFVEGATAQHDMEQFARDARNDHPDIHRIAMLDFLIGQTDRHTGNFMRGEDGRYYAIDNGFAIVKDNQIGELGSATISAVAGRRIPDEVRAQIQQLSEAKIKEIMKRGRFKDKSDRGMIARWTVLMKLKTWPKRESTLRAKSVAEDALLMTRGM
jgi:hypothetical protein